MATYTIQLRKDGKKEKNASYPIVITVYEGEKKERYSIGYKVPENNWDEENHKVKGRYPDKDFINSVIDSKESIIKQVIAECSIQRRPVPIGRIFKTQYTGDSFTSYMRTRADQLFKDGKVSIERKITDLAGEIEACFNGGWNTEDINKESVQILKNSFKEKERPNSQNTIRKKLAYLSRFYNELMEDSKAPAPNPFKGHNLKLIPAKKAKHDKKQIHLLEKTEYKNPNYRLAVDMWLFAYYCQGIRFENCATIRKKKDIKDGRIHYRVNKGLKLKSAKIHSKLQSIIDKYDSMDPVFVFPLGPGRTDIVAYFKEKNPGNELKKKYKSAINKRNTMINEWLWKAGKKIDIDDISFHTARHTFAFHMKQVTNNIHVIKDALGHSTTQQTEVYLNELDDEVIDKEVAKLYGN